MTADFIVPIEKDNDPIIKRTAKILLIMLGDHNRAGTPLTQKQATFNLPTLVSASGENLITEGFLEALEDEFSQLGWYMFRTLDRTPTWGIIHVDALDKTIKLGPKRVMEYRSLLTEQLAQLLKSLSSAS